MLVGRSAHTGRLAPSRMYVSPIPFLSCRNSIWNQDSFTKYWNKWRNLCPLEEFDCLSKQMTALLHRTCPLVWHIIQVASIFLFPVLTGNLKSLISSYENRWAGLNCCTFASIKLRYALKLFSFVSIQAALIQELRKRGGKKAGSRSLADVLLLFLPYSRFFVI